MPASTLQLMPACPPGARIPEIDRLKGLALLLVVANHTSGALDVTDWVHGEVGVDIFLILSGFTLALNSAALSGAEFFRRRFLRIYPAYWIALGLFVAANAHFFNDHRRPADLWLHVIGLHAFGPPAYFSSVNDSFWFISIIVLLYGVFFSLRRHLQDLGLVAGVGALLTSAVCLFYLETGNIGALVHLGVRLPDLFIGVVLGQLASGRKSDFKLGAVLAAGLLALAYLTVYRGVNFGDPVAGLAWIVCFLWVDRLILRTAAGPAFTAFFAFFGLYSYEIYLLHQPLIRDYNRLALASWWQVMQPTSGVLAASIAAAFLLVIFLSIQLHRATDWLFRSLRRTSLR
jgi:peptidoglycan/LPS O-acetylase OafA/YrhL